MQIVGVQGLIEALRDFWLAQAELDTAWADKLTLKHGEVRNLDKAKPGDRVRFRAKKTARACAVTAIELAR
ncbi:MAG: hypothetical protein ACKO8N_11030 [Rubrivivax sp.]